MQGDNHYQRPQETSARVRHVPIQIESRDNRTRSNQQKLYTEKNQADHDRYYQQPHHHHQNQHLYEHQHHNQQQNPNAPYNGSHHTLPNTSSININYDPQQQSSKTINNHLDQSANQQDSKRADNNHEKHEESQSSQDKSPSNQAKTVSPPEVIPLPPPPKSPQPNSTRVGNDSPQQQQQQQQQPQPQQQPQQQKTPQHSCKSNEKQPGDVVTSINDVKSDVTNLLEAIASFSGTSAKSKEYRYLDEMLTRCILKLDQLECGDSAELRQYRKAAIKLVDRATDILQRKLQINSDIHELSDNMTAHP